MVGPERSLIEFWPGAELFICQWNKIEIPETDPYTYGQMIFDKNVKAM